MDEKTPAVPEYQYLFYPIGASKSIIY